MEEHDQYESVGLDESLEDERDLDQIMADRRAAEMELDARLLETVLLLNGSFLICFMIKIPVVTCSLCYCYNVFFWIFCGNWSS
ncbi:putative DNA helicase [Helianthus debilis subsp. tardiflorus]